MIALNLLIFGAGVALGWWWQRPLAIKGRLLIDAQREQAKKQGEHDAKRKALYAQLEAGEQPYVCGECRRIGQGAVSEQYEDWHQSDGAYVAERTLWLTCKCGADIKQLDWPVLG